MRIASMYMSLGLPMSRVVQLLLDDNQTVGDAVKKLEFEALTARPHNSNPKPKPKPNSNSKLASEALAASPQEDAILPDMAVAPASTGTRVLVTGATGFLGPFVVDLLVKRFGPGAVVCLVRAHNDEEP